MIVIRKNNRGSFIHGLAGTLIHIAKIRTLVRIKQGVILINDLFCRSHPMYFSFMQKHSSLTKLLNCRS
ncbi:hypothetical protein ACM14_05130 [Delftia sp. JD2]|nr:hypothetical protein ACM14_05130 [Delftia sp. JD2]